MSNMSYKEKLLYAISQAEAAANTARAREASEREGREALKKVCTEVSELIRMVVMLAKTEKMEVPLLPPRASGVTLLASSEAAIAGIQITARLVKALIEGGRTRDPTAVETALIEELVTKIATVSEIDRQKHAVSSYELSEVLLEISGQLPHESPSRSITPSRSPAVKRQAQSAQELQATGSTQVVERTGESAKEKRDVPYTHSRGVSNTTKMRDVFSPPVAA